jgi:hypothetical protein
MKEKKNSGAPYREQLFGGGFYNQTRVFVVGDESPFHRGLAGNDSDSPFEVKNGNKLSAKTASSRNLEDFALIPCRAFIYGHFRGGNATRKSGDPNGIRTRVTAVKGQCPNRWTIGSEGECR